MKINLKEIAERAGVSLMTASNVINGREGRYSQVTYDLVMRVAAELGYKPNLSAKHLRNGKMGLIALVLPDIMNPYLSELSQFVIEEADSQGYTIILNFTANDSRTVRAIVDGSLKLPVDGIMMAPHLLDVSEFKLDIPVLLFGERQPETAFDNIVLDNFSIAKMATQHLIDLGYRKIAPIGVVNGSDLGGMPQQRLEGYRYAMQATGLEIDPDWLITVASPDFHRDHGTFVMEQLLAQTNRPDAVFCFNDLLALGAIKIIIQNGLKVPEDVAVIGVDDIIESKYYNPSLSSIFIDRQKSASLGVKLLLDRISGARNSAPEFFEVPFTLMSRESTLGKTAITNAEGLDMSIDTS